MKIRKKYLMLVLFVTVSIAVSVDYIYVNKYKNKAAVKEMNFYWQDEFSGENGSGVDAAKWVHDMGSDGWGNSEEEYYTDGTNNCYIQDGNLVIEAKKENLNNCQYTSARIKTKGKFDFKYGRIEMRAKIPYGQGIWPAFWMLGSDIDELGWPDCGEIDIMENVGKEPQTIYGTLHGPGYSGNMSIGNKYISEEDFKNSFHVYSVEWSENKIDWFVDGKLYHSMNPNTVIGNKWAFNKNFFLLINLAVGGNWPGAPDDTTVFPQKYYIDYVRVYR